MTLKLVVLRHAKSGWDDPSLPDHARSLTDRGRRDAKAVGGWLAAQGHVPDLILSSDATRTGQTIAGVIDGIGQDIRTDYLPRLYNASSDTILSIIREQTAATLLICAHNPGIGDAAARLVTVAPAHGRFADYPTAATTVLSFDAGTWAQITTADSVSFVIPADLKT